MMKCFKTMIVLCMLVGAISAIGAESMYTVWKANKWTVEPTIAAYDAGEITKDDLSFVLYQTMKFCVGDITAQELWDIIEAPKYEKLLSTICWEVYPRIVMADKDSDVSKLVLAKIAKLKETNISCYHMAMCRIGATIGNYEAGLDSSIAICSVSKIALYASYISGEEVYTKLIDYLLSHDLSADRTNKLLNIVIKNSLSMDTDQVAKDFKLLKRKYMINLATDKAAWEKVIVGIELTLKAL